MCHPLRKQMSDQIPCRSAKTINRIDYRINEASFHFIVKSNAKDYVQRNFYNERTRNSPFNTITEDKFTYNIEE